MPKRSSKEENQIVASIIGHLTDPGVATKNPAAVALGKLGGLKGGPARAQKLSPQRRKAIAKKAAKSRWKK